jgi:signal peptidase I
MTEAVKRQVDWFWREWVKPLLIVAIVLGSFRSAVADWNDVPTGSMKPTILEGDRIFVNKVAYDLKVPFTTWHLAEWGQPARGDIVVLWSPVDGQRLVKRVVAVPGDTVEVRDGRVLINGVLAHYEPITSEERHRWQIEDLHAAVLANETVEGRSHPVMTSSEWAAGPAYGPEKVPAGRYFLLGDHRDNSYDSRFWGFADRQRILGRASAVVLSLDREDHYKPRWRRFFSRLP